jgi:hypothetical protein
MDVYTERAYLVRFLATKYNARFGVDPNEPDWPVIYIDTPTGQLSWHISPNDMHLFENISHDANVKWDGHTTEEKYRRLHELSVLIDREEVIEHH